MSGSGGSSLARFRAWLRSRALALAALMRGIAVALYLVAESATERYRARQQRRQASVPLEPNGGRPEAGRPEASHDPEGEAGRRAWLRRAARAVAIASRPLVRLRNAFLYRWRRSLQFRTVLMTLVLTFAAFGAVGAYLSSQIAHGLFNERLQQAEVETRRGVQQVQETFDGAQVGDQQSAQKLVNDTLPLLEGSGTEIQRRFLLIAVPNQPSSRPRWVDTRASFNIVPTMIPQDLRSAVQNGSGQYWRSINLPLGTKDVPAIAVGNKVTFNGSVYELYLLYDLSNAQDTLDYIQGVLWIGGMVLVLLIGAIAWYVTRAVVSPVRHAAIVSEKLAGGHLQERMVVRGEDEVARLGASFNHMAASLQEQITQLANLSQMQQRFVSDVSHELRTPLTTVRMAAEVLHDARDSFDPVNRRSAELLYHQVERFQDLLADLLEISRFDAGAAVLDPEYHDILPLIRKVVEDAQPLADNCGSSVNIGTAGSGFIVEMDSRRIERILRNLLVNALEHGEGRPVEIMVAANEEAVAVAVRDHGIGMSPAAVARVFDRFWRADPARARTTGGSGLGLSIATEDARLHGGWLQAWGKENEGSCFRLTLPLKVGGVIHRSPLPLPPGQVAGTGRVHVPAAITSAPSTPAEQPGLPDQPASGPAPTGTTHRVEASS